MAIDIWFCSQMGEPQLNWFKTSASQSKLQHVGVNPSVSDTLTSRYWLNYTILYNVMHFLSHVNSRGFPIPCILIGHFSGWCLRKTQLYRADLPPFYRRWCRGGLDLLALPAFVARRVLASRHGGPLCRRAAGAQRPGEVSKGIYAQMA